MGLHEYESKHTEIVRETLSECMVLLKKDGSFPLKKPCRIAAYGGGVRGTISGGTGSGEVNSRYTVTIEQGLRDAGFEVTTENWLEEYHRRKQESRADFVRKLKQDAKKLRVSWIIHSMGKSMPEPEHEMKLGEKAECAVYVLARNSGEGSDRTCVRGDIKLTESEIRDILELDRSYEKFMLVLNVGGVVDLSPVTGVRNILLLSQLGAETGYAFARVLLGKMNPSGRLAATWAAVDDYVRMDDFDDYNETRYREGIFVGYRYFDAFGKDPLFPFGYGLSYTEFTYRVTEVRTENGRVRIVADVRNTGHYPGKQVLQAYVSAPCGRLGKALRDLAAFTKTAELQPGEETRVELLFELADVASYDEKKEAYVLEAGEYEVSVGTDSRTLDTAAVIVLQKEVIVRRTKNVLGKTDFEDMRAPDRKAVNARNTRKISMDPEEIRERIPKESCEEILPEIDGLDTDELCYMNIGDFDPKKGGLTGIIGNAGRHVCGAAGESAGKVRDFPYMVMADGPAGLRLARQYYADAKGLHSVGQSSVPDSFLEFMPEIIKRIIRFLDSSKKPPRNADIREQYCTAIPIGTAVAQSFNVELAEAYGDLVGEEMERFGVNLWLAPALNIQRSIRCGRNFEYYSEDPLVSGKIAAGITKGVQRHKGCGVTLKHFAANNKELNRACNNSIVSERAMREIYLKGFEICIRESGPKAVMTSYNLLNGVHTAENRGLIENILRCEFCFDGIVMTDWIIQAMAAGKTMHRNTKADCVARAGGDLFMPGSRGDFKTMKKAVKKGELEEKQLKINASRVLKMAKSLQR